MNKKSVAQNYTFLAIMLGAMILGALFGWLAPSAATAIKPLGTVFINMMFCIVVPLVFSSIAGAVANMKSRRRAGKIMGVTVATFVITGAIAAVIMFLLIQVFPPVLTPWTELQAEEMGEYATISDMIVNFFTASDFVGLLSRRAMLPLIVPVFLSAFQRADELATAMEARGYRGAKYRTRRRSAPLSASAWAALGACTALCAITLVLYFI